MKSAENNIRKDFTSSEKVEIARRIEEALAGRNHRPAKVGKDLPGSELPKGKSSDLAADAVGWSGETYRQAKRVVEEGKEEKSRHKLSLEHTRTTTLCHAIRPKRDKAWPRHPKRP